MSETLTSVEGSAKTDSILPFALQFLEVIPPADLEEVSGHYNEKQQVWDYGVASKIGIERPPTVSTVPTPISVKVVRADKYVDD